MKMKKINNIKKIRVMKTIYEYIVEPKFSEFVDNIVTDKQYLDDFKSFVIEILLTKPDYYTTLIENKFIDYVVIKIMTNQWRSTTSPFYRQYRTRIVDMNREKQNNYLINTDYQDKTVEEFEEIDREEALLIEAINTLEPGEQVIIKSLFGLNGFKKFSYRGLAKEIDVNYNTIFLHAKGVKEKIRLYIEEKI